jgi:hypothetical protein
VWVRQPLLECVIPILTVRRTMAEEGGHCAAQKMLDRMAGRVFQSWIVK